MSQIDLKFKLFSESKAIAFRGYTNLKQLIEGNSIAHDKKILITQEALCKFSPCLLNSRTLYSKQVIDKASIKSAHKKRPFIIFIIF